MASIEYVLPDGVTLHWTDSPAVTPEQLDIGTTLYNGGAETGNLQFMIPAAEGANGTIAIEPDMFSKKKFFAVK